MKKKHNNSARASALWITLTIILAFVSASLVILAASEPLRTSSDPSRSDVSPPASTAATAASAASNASKWLTDLKPAEVKFATGPEHVAGGPTWAPTGSLNTERSEHTATLLPNGKVLVAGDRGL